MVAWSATAWAQIVSVRLVLAFVSLSITLVLQGCGSAPTPTTTTTTTTQYNPVPPTKPGPLRGIAYGALPCTQPCQAAGDMVQEAYESQWGSANGGRDDLGTMASLGANHVRLYWSIGCEWSTDHKKFLDHAQEKHMQVMPAWNCGSCPNYDCHDSIKQALLDSFKVGFADDRAWHPAVNTLILANEIDSCTAAGHGNDCRVRYVLSALDGALSAEKEAGIKGSVMFTATWSFAEFTSVDNKVKGPGIFGFQDMLVSTLDPSLAKYTPKNDVLTAYRNRWIHSVNVQAPWNYVKDQIAPHYEPYKGNFWMISEYGAEWQMGSEIFEQMKAMDETAQNQADPFLGAVMFQFQTSYSKGFGSELHFGLFALGTKKVGTAKPCDKGNCPQEYPVYCTTSDLGDHMYGKMTSKNHRAEALAHAWNGSVPDNSGCPIRDQVPCVGCAEKEGQHSIEVV